MGSRGESRAEATDLRLPDRYRLRRRLATGGMAAVWCAEDLVLGRTVAVKVLAESFAHDEMATRRFKREARAAARVSNHAHVVTIYDVGDLEVDERDVDAAVRPFIVMEYLAGGTVADALRVVAVRRQEAVRWIREAASALDHAHARGIVHRDIKPANFLLNRSRVLHVADFGIARLVSEDTISSSGELFGTAAYLSPEQALGREATGASDRYALTVAAFELLTGGRPFMAEHFAAQARQHIEDEPPRASERDRTLPAPVDEVLIRGMAKAPDERFETAGAFVDALETALSGGIPVTQRLSGPRRRTRLHDPLAGAAGANGKTNGKTNGKATGNGKASDNAHARPRPRRQAASAHASHPPALAGGRRPAPATGAWTAADSITQGSTGRRRTGRLVALVALLVAIGGVGALALGGLGGAAPRHVAQRSARAPARSGHAARSRPVATSKPKPATTTNTTASTVAAQTTTAAAPATSAPPTAQQLQLTGHNELTAGQYPAAIATLRKALVVADKSSLTYAYGLYDLGLALLRSGDAAGAVPVLEERLKIPNQTPTVQQALDEALRQSGQAPAAKPAPQGPAKGAGHGNPHSGGAGLGPAGPGAGNEHPNFVD